MHPASLDTRSFYEKASPHASVPAGTACGPTRRNAQPSTTPGTTVVKIVRATGRRSENEGADDNVLRVLRDIPDRRYDANAATYEISEAR
jgi:hypothetical protein